jgi:hypothetical protein
MPFENAALSGIGSRLARLGTTHTVALLLARSREAFCFWLFEFGLEIGDTDDHFLARVPLAGVAEMATPVMEQDGGHRMTNTGQKTNNNQQRSPLSRRSLGDLSGLTPNSVSTTTSVARA